MQSAFFLSLLEQFERDEVNPMTEDHAQNNQPPLSALSIDNALTKDALSQLRNQISQLPVLSPDQEKQIVAHMHITIHKLVESLLTHTKTRDIFAKLITTLLQPADNKIRDIPASEYFALRRERLEVLKPTDQRQKLQLFLDTINCRHSSSTLLAKQAQQLYWPPPLIIGFCDLFLQSPQQWLSLPLAMKRYLAIDNDTARQLSQQLCQKQREHLATHYQRYFRYRNQLIKHNIRLVYHIGKKHSDFRTPILDVIQEGIFGLIRAAEMFRPSTGYRFSTYAYNWIEAKTRRAGEKMNNTIKLPSSLTVDLNRLHRTLNRLRQKGEQSISTQLASELALPQEKLSELLQLRSRGLSLDQGQYGDDEALNLAGILPSDTNCVISEASTLELPERIKGLVDGLPDRQAHIINQRFGLLGIEPQTIETIGHTLGISRERVRQLEKEALATLRRRLTNTRQGEDLQL